MTPSPNSAAGSGAAATDSAPRHVLLVEDNLLVCLALRGLLEEAGFTVTVMENGLAAWDRLQSGVEPPAAVLSDLSLPGLSGRDLLQRMQTLPRRIPVAVITGHADEQMVEELLGLGAAAVIGKPVLPADLISTMRGILGGV